jgi:hypothetical protein
MAEPNLLNRKQDTPFIDNQKVEKLIHKIINLSREMNCSMVELVQACKSIQIAGTVEINGALAQMVDAELTNKQSEKQKYSKQRTKTKKRQAENSTDNHNH